MLVGVDASRAALARLTGTENYSLQLIRSLVALPGGHRFRLYTNGSPHPGTFPTGPAIEVRPLPFPRLWTHVRLAWEVAREPPDALFVPAHVLPAVHPTRSVVTVHDLGYLDHPEAHSPISRWYLDLMTRRSAAGASAVIAVSRATRDDLIRRYRVDPGKVSVVHHGVDHGRFRPLEGAGGGEDLARRQGIRPPYFLHVGTIHPRKNLGVLFAAMRALRARGSEASLALAGGRGWRAEEVLARAGEGVHELGYVEAGDLPALMRGAIALVMPSLHEGFGLPVLEAMACGTPAICSWASSLPEVAGEAAVLADPHDSEEWAGAMDRILSDEAFRRWLVERGLARAGEFTWERCARETLDVLERVGGANG